MNFELTEEQQLLQKSVREFAEAEVRPRAKELDETGHFPRDLFAKAAELGLTGRHVFFNDGWVPYAGRADYLLEADIGISLHEDHVETAYSFRTRILDCIWAGLPIVATGGDAFAELIDREGLGSVVPAGDVEAVADALVELLEDSGRRDACRERAAIVAPRFAWSAALEPLIRFCAHPVRAPDGPAVPALPTERTGGNRGDGAEPPGAARRVAGMVHRAWAVYRAEGVRELTHRSVRAVRRRI